MAPTITAHGVTYLNVTAAESRYWGLAAENSTSGISDGRVTEMNAIQSALSENA